MFYLCWHAWITVSNIQSPRAHYLGVEFPLWIPNLAAPSALGLAGLQYLVDGCAQPIFRGDYTVHSASENNTTRVPVDC